jgi:hypothetical protein
MKTIKNDYCIRMFVGHDNLRPEMTKVNLDGDYLYATNGHMIAKVKSDLCVQKYHTVEKFPNTEKLISEHQSSEKKTVSIDTLFNELMVIECCFKPKMIACEECDGDGKTVCDHCDSESDCKECDGVGKVQGTELELTSEFDCSLFNRKYNLNYLEMILRTAIYTGVQEIEISNGQKVTSGTLFTVGDFTIYLMPIYRL